MYSKPSVHYDSDISDKVRYLHNIPTAREMSLITYYHCQGWFKSAQCTIKVIANTSTHGSELVGKNVFIFQYKRLFVIGGLF